MRDSVRPARSSIQGRHKLTIAWRSRRCRAGQAFAHDERQGASSSGASARSVISRTAVAVLVLDPRRQIGGHARHAIGAQRLDAGPLHCLEHGARRPAEGASRACSRASWQAAVSARLSANRGMTATRGGRNARRLGQLHQLAVDLRLAGA